MYDLAGVALNAVSVGGMETHIGVPTYKVGFDMGRCIPDAWKLQRIFFTHTHMDHIGAIAVHCATRVLKGQSPAEYWVPLEKYEQVANLLAAWRAVDNSNLTHTLTPVSPGDEFQVGKSRYVKAFRAIHSIPALGYSVVDRRKRLKSEYEGLSVTELVHLRKAGTDVDEAYDHPLLSFCGDTCIDVLDRESHLCESDLLILEVTFLDDGVPVESARRHGHVHIDEVVARAEQFKNKTVLFTHPSSRYTDRHIIKAYTEKLAGTPLMGRAHILLPNLGVWRMGDVDGYTKAVEKLG